MNTTTELENSNTKKISNFIKQLIIKNRLRSIIVSALLGLMLVLWWIVDHSWFPSLEPLGEIITFFKTIEIGQGTCVDLTVIILLLASPPLFVWWVIKTDDTGKKIRTLIFNNVMGKLSVCKSWILDNRVWSLIISAILGIALAYWWFALNGKIPWCPLGKTLPLIDIIGIDPKSKGKGLDASLTTLFLALPTLFVLWILRTNDTREQIRETQNNTLTSMLTHGLDMITSNDFKRRYAGLIQLGQLRIQTDKFNAQIDSATRNLDLTALDLDGKPVPDEEDSMPGGYQRALLMKAPLQGMDLSGAKLRGADLQFADLRGTHLTNADLRDVTFSGADVSDADLSSAKLSNTFWGQNFGDSYAPDAIYVETKFPKDFIPG